MTSQTIKLPPSIMFPVFKAARWAANKFVRGNGPWKPEDVNLPDDDYVVQAFAEFEARIRADERTRNDAVIRYTTHMALNKEADRLEALEADKRELQQMLQEWREFKRAFLYIASCGVLGPNSKPISTHSTTYVAGEPEEYVCCNCGEDFAFAQIDETTELCEDCYEYIMGEERSNGQ